MVPLRVSDARVSKMEQALAQLTLHDGAVVIITDMTMDALSLVLVRLPLAHDIAAVASVCWAFLDAVRHALMLRPYSSHVIRLTRHGKRVTAIVAAPDGHIVASSEAGTINVWHVNAAFDAASRFTVAAHAMVTAMALLPDGAHFLTCGYSIDDFGGDPNLKLWKFDGTIVRSWDDSVATDVTSVAVLPDGVHFVVGLGGGADHYQVKMYRVDGTHVHSFMGHTNEVHALAVTRDGGHIISGSADKLVKVWNVASKSLVSTCAGHTDYVEAVAVTPDGRRILSGSVKEVRVWLLDDGTLENTFS